MVYNRSMYVLFPTKLFVANYLVDILSCKLQVFHSNKSVAQKHLKTLLLLCFTCSSNYKSWCNQKYKQHIFFIPNLNNIINVSGITCKKDGIALYDHRSISEAATYFLNQYVSLQCGKGYVNIGTKRQYCLENERWSTAKPKCAGKNNAVYHWKRFIYWWAIRQNSVELARRVIQLTKLLNNNIGRNRRSYWFSDYESNCTILNFCVRQLQRRPFRLQLNSQYLSILHLGYRS